MRKRTRLRELGPVDSSIRGPNVVEIFVCLNAIKGLKILEVGNDNGVLFGFSGNHEPRIYRSLKLKSTVDCLSPICIVSGKFLFLVGTILFTSSQQA